MEQIQKTFREQSALREPVSYWAEKARGHRTTAWITGIASFLAMGAAGAALTWQSQKLIAAVEPGGAPDGWRFALLATFGLFAVWAVRLVVRMFLSHLHLLTDANERTVMARTYLSLLEGDRLASKDDRQLILQALFRPASDGIVKDEAVPASMAELFTRQGR